MKTFLEEILEIPTRSETCFQKNQNIKLPVDVPYLGMGASYFAALTLYYAGAKIKPQISSEYFNYLSFEKEPKGVLISTSGETSETLWNLERFENITAITNNLDSPLAQKSQNVIDLSAGLENFAATKTYFNTLLVLYLGLGVDLRETLSFTRQNIINKNFIQKTESMAREVILREKVKAKSFYVLGNGPNIATASQGALILSETTKLPWIGMPFSQFFHGPIETAQDGVLIILRGSMQDLESIDALKKILDQKSKVLILELESPKIFGKQSPFPLIAQLDLLANFLCQNLGIDPGYKIGSKVTKI